MPIIEPDPILGEAIANYPSNRLRPLIIAGIVGSPVGLIVMWLSSQDIPGWERALLVLIMAVVSLPLIWYVLHLWNREIVLYARGFSYREGSRVIYFLYDEIASIRLRAEQLAYFGGLLRRKVYRYTVTTSQDEHFTITNLYLRADELGTRLTEQIDRVLGPKIARKLANGDAVAFGDTLTVRADGLRDRDRVLVWANFGSYRIGGHKLALLDASGTIWYSAPLAEVDNITLLLELLRERQPVKRA